jgi:hypothetical protein
MVTLFPARCPVNAGEKRWIEASMLWLVEQFGAQTLREAEVILPTEDYFPDPYEGTRDCAQRLFELICEYMGVDATQMRLELYSEGVLPASSLPPGVVVHTSGTAGQYGAPVWAGDKPVVAVEAAGLQDPPGLVGTLAHEIGHFLLSGRELPRSRMERELLTDLVPIFFGLGILTAEVAFRFSRLRQHRYQGWRVSSQGYLSEPMFGYALAAFAWLRGERKPPWAPYLPLNIRTYLKRSLAYLLQGGETSLPTS